MERLLMAIVSAPDITLLPFLRKYQQLSVDVLPPKTESARVVTGIKLKHYFINFANCAAKIKKWEEKLDTDGDGKVSEAEAKADTKMAKQLKRGKAKMPVMKRMDAMRTRLGGRRRPDEIRLAVKEVRFGKGLPKHYQTVLAQAIAKELVTTQLRMKYNGSSIHPVLESTAVASFRHGSPSEVS